MDEDPDSPIPEERPKSISPVLTPQRSPISSISSTRSPPNFYGEASPEPIRRMEPEEDRPVTGQHNIAHYNLARQNAPDNLFGMSEGLSADIIRNSLNEFANPNQDINRNISPDHNSSQSSNVHQVEAQVHSTDNSASSTASSVSSNIDFNFEPFDDDISANENDFPITTFHPTRVSQRDSQEIPWNIPIGQTQESPKTGRLSTRF